jgi:hypothetical protein
MMNPLLGLAIRCLACVCIFVLPLRSHAQTSAKNHTSERDLAVRLAFQKKVLFAGEVVEFEIRISNLGKQPLLVAHSMSDAGGGSAISIAHIKFELRDEQGHPSPGMVLIADDFGVSGGPKEDQAAALLRSYLLLYPGDSFVTQHRIGPDTFAYLRKPGNYTLSAVYSSGGLLAGLRGPGLTDEAVKALPFEAWHGSVATNTVSFKILPLPQVRTSGKR